MSDDLGMRALRARWRSGRKPCSRAGCDVALVCGGDLAETETAAGVVPPLRGAAHARFERLCRFQATEHLRRGRGRGLSRRGFARPRLNQV